MTNLIQSTVNQSYYLSTLSTLYSSSLSIYTVRSIHTTYSNTHPSISSTHLSSNPSIHHIPATITKIHLFIITVHPSITPTPLYSISTLLFYDFSLVPITHISL